MKLRSGSSAKPFGRKPLDAAAPRISSGGRLVMDPRDAAAAIGREHVASRRHHDAFRPRQVLAQEGQVGPRDDSAIGA